MYRKIFIGFFIFIFFLTIETANTFSAIEMLSDEELSDVDGQFSEIRVISHEKQDDTVRIFLDIHQEIYGTVETARVGYYYKDSSQLRTTPLSIGLSGFDGFYHGADNVHNGANFSFIKVTSDFNTMAPSNGSTLEPWGNGSFDSSNQGTIEATTTPNCNNFDWDVWVDNIQLGESPDKPMVMNGMIVRLQFDSSIYSQDPHLKRIIVGTNDGQGNSYYNVQRITAAMNGLLVSGSTNRSAGAQDPYKHTAATMMVQRDTLVQCFGITVKNVEDRDIGQFLVINLEGDHLGFTVIEGFPENGVNVNFHGSEGSTGHEGIEIFDPSWAPLPGNVSGLEGRDPYNTARQEEYDGTKDGY